MRSFHFFDTVTGLLGLGAIRTEDLPIGPLKITYTGTPRGALVLPLVPGIAVVPAVAVDGQATYAPAAGPYIASLMYMESNVPVGPRLLTISFDDLAGTSGNFSPTTMASLTALRANAMVSVGITFSPSVMASLTVLETNAMVSVGGNYSPSTMASLTALRANAMVSVGGSYAPATMASLTVLEANAMVSVGSYFGPSTMASLTVLSYPSLACIGTTFSPSNMESLTTVDLPAMVNYGTTIAIPSASMGNVNSVVLGTVGTLKSIGGATITLSGLKLDATSVNALLALLVSLDGTNGTTEWGTGKTLLINGGTNAAPSGQGATDKATLQARGATITTN
jgi:hypothetical protein